MSGPHDPPPRHSGPVDDLHDGLPAQQNGHGASASPTAGPSLAGRLAGALLGLAAGDALGATVEFCSPENIRLRYGAHRDIVGGGSFGWRPGQGTDDTDLAYVVARAYAKGYSLRLVADGFLRWFEHGPRDVGGTTAAALGHLRCYGDPTASGLAVSGRAMGAGNGSLMRCLATGLVRRDASQRRAEAATISAVTHADRRCTQACTAYCDLVAYLVEGASSDQAITEVLASSPIGTDVGAAIAAAAGLGPSELDVSGFVLATLQVGVWAVLQPRSLEDVHVEVVALGGDADTTAAVAGGLLGARDGEAALPRRWTDRLEYRDSLMALVPALLAERAGRRPASEG